jgi:antitoxin (DNA-binding transcriptional repressor) of toxin-antitoxin stability system
VDVRFAKINLFRLIEAALAGQDVVIASDNTPVVRLVAIGPAAFKIDVLSDRVKAAGPDFLSPMGKDELDLCQGGAGAVVAITCGHSLSAWA